jgi:voltage-gated potassium channel Kch
MVNEVLVALGIVAICVLIHTIGMLMFAEWLVKRRSKLYRESKLTNHAMLLILVFAFVIFLHLAETALWAVFYRVQGLFEDFETSLYFSLVSYTTTGFGDVVLPEKWRLLGAMEGLSGILLCGISTAFIFAFVNNLFRLRLRESALPWPPTPPSE